MKESKEQKLQVRTFNSDSVMCNYATKVSKAELAEKY